jgi:protein-disulfide isomerase
MARRSPKSSPPAQPGARTLWLLAGLGLASAGWAVHLWNQLLIGRAGGEVACGFGDSGACTAVWDSAFASMVHGATGLPVAGWGLVWGIAALLLPLLVLWAHRRGSAGKLSWAATLMTAAAGVLGVGGLAVALLVGGSICQSCVVTYVLVLAYASVAFLALRGMAWPDLARGAGLAAGLVGAAWGVLLVPGLRTPPAVDPTAALPEPAAGAERAAAPRDLPGYLASLSPPTAQALSDELQEFRGREPGPLREPRALIGSSMAALRITDFADLMCSHCASLHRTLEQVRALASEGSIAIESRYFPLDGKCNPQIKGRTEEGVRCIAARALICLEGEPEVFEYAGRLYAGQRTLTGDRVYEVLGPLRDRAQLELCVDDPMTHAKLREDIEWAQANGITGTPLVLVNGRRASAFPPLLYALALAAGNPDHPAFAELPAPSPPRPAAAGAPAEG